MPDLKFVEILGVDGRKTRRRRRRRKRRRRRGTKRMRGGTSVHQIVEILDRPLMT